MPPMKKCLRGIHLPVFLRLFCHDRKGAVAIIFALSIIPVMVGIAGSLSINTLQTSRSAAKAIADATALNAASIADNRSTRQNAAETFLEKNFASSNNNNTELENINIDFHDNDKKVIVNFEIKLPLMLAGFLGKDNVNLSIESTALYPKKEPTLLSIGFAVNMTGSTYDTNLPKVLLRWATIAAMGRAYNGNDYVRMGFAIHNGRRLTQLSIISSRQEHYQRRVWANIQSEGPTNTQPPMSAMLDMIKAEGRYYPDAIRVVVLMTPGNSTGEAYADLPTQQICNNMKADGVIVHTVYYPISAGQPRLNSVINFLKNCAGNGGKYHNVSGPYTLREDLAELRRIALEGTEKPARLE